MPWGCSGGHLGCSFSSSLWPLAELLCTCSRGCPMGLMRQTDHRVSLNQFAALISQAHTYNFLLYNYFLFTQQIILWGLHIPKCSEVSTVSYILVQECSVSLPSLVINILADFLSTQAATCCFNHSSVSDPFLVVMVLAFSRLVYLGFW